MDVVHADHAVDGPDARDVSTGRDKLYRVDVGGRLDKTVTWEPSVHAAFSCEDLLIGISDGWFTSGGIKMVQGSCGQGDNRPHSVPTAAMCFGLRSGISWYTTTGIENVERLCKAVQSPTESLESDNGRNVVRSSSQPSATEAGSLEPIEEPSAEYRDAEAHKSSGTDSVTGVGEQPAPQEETFRPAAQLNHDPYHDLVRTSRGKPSTVLEAFDMTAHLQAHAREDLLYLSIPEGSSVRGTCVAVLELYQTYSPNETPHPESAKTMHFFCDGIAKGWFTDDGFESVRSACEEVCVLQEDVAPTPRDDRRLQKGADPPPLPPPPPPDDGDDTNECLLPNDTNGYSIPDAPDTGTAVTVTSLGDLSCIDGKSVGEAAAASCSGVAVGSDTADWTTISTGLDGSSKWARGVPAGNGKIYGIPNGAGEVLIVDPTTDTFDRTAMSTGLDGGCAGACRKWVGGVLAGNGKIYGIPDWARTGEMLIIDPIRPSPLEFAGCTICAPDCGCSPGSYDDDNSATTPCTECPAGSVTDTLTSYGAVACASCSAGQYSATASSPCADCAPGTADLDSDPSTQCSQCSAGEFSASYGAVACTSCSAGQYSAAASTSPCADCAPGTADLDYDPSTQCSQCSAGEFSARNVSTSCDPCPVGRLDDDGDPSTPCLTCGIGFFAPARTATACSACGAGQYAANASVRCVSCVAGQSDHDSNASTACVPCTNGTYAGCGETACARCEAGSVDADGNQATPCTPCPPGTNWADSPEEMAAICLPCAIGRADNDSISTTDCVQCPSGTYAATQSVECAPCTSGMSDHDSDASTACVRSLDAPECAQECGTGFDDDDCDDSDDSPCVACGTGTYSSGGIRATPTESLCVACSPGQYAPEGSERHECQQCQLGTADTDGDAWTQCESCPGGTSTADDTGTASIWNATQCIPCQPGHVDDDSNASTAW